MEMIYQFASGTENCFLRRLRFLVGCFQMGNVAKHFAELFVYDISLAARANDVLIRKVVARGGLGVGLSSSVLCCY